MKVALAQAKRGRLHILGEMAKALSTARTEMSEYAPRLITIKIHPDKIREVIGKGGATIRSITEEIMKVALAQAKAGRLHILGEMANALTTPRSELSEYAPRLLTIKIHPDKIREVIGKGGSTIQAITKETGTQIDIQDDGTIVIASVNAAAAQAAKARIEQITSDVEPGRIYEGKVAKIMDFGAFVTILPGKDGLVHVSQISSERVEKVSDKLKEGDLVKVKVLEVDKQGRIRLSIKAVEEGEGVAAE